MSATKDWLPAVDEPLGITNTAFVARLDGGESVYVRVSPENADEVRVQLHFPSLGIQELLIRDGSLAYALAGARKSRSLGGPARGAR